MRTLFKDFLWIIGFWYFVSLILVGFDTLRNNLKLLTQLQEFYSSIPILARLDVSSGLLDELSTRAPNNFFDTIPTQLALITFWSTPILIGGLILFFTSYFLMRTRAKLLLKNLAKSVTATEKWNGVSITLGELPKPITPPRVEIELNYTAEIKKELDRLNPEQLALFQAILATIAFKPEHYAGAGHGVGLLEHTLNVIDKLAELKPSSPLAYIVAAAHDLGKLWAWRKDDEGDWIRIRKHDKEGARILGMLPEMLALTEFDRVAITFAVKYDHSPAMMPSYYSGRNAEAVELAKQLIKEVAPADQQSTKEEKEQVIKEADVDDLVFKAFITGLSRIVWQPGTQVFSGMPPDRKPGVFKIGPTVHIMEHRIRKAILEQLPADLAAALGEAEQRNAGKTAKLTTELLRILDAKGWLVREMGGFTLPVNRALWDLFSGDKGVLKAMIVVNIHPDYSYLKNNPESGYPIKLDCPHFKKDADNMKKAVEAAEPAVKSKNHEMAMDLLSALNKPVELKTTKSSSSDSKNSTQIKESNTDPSQASQGSELNAEDSKELNNNTPAKNTEKAFKFKSERLKESTSNSLESSAPSEINSGEHAPTPLDESIIKEEPAGSNQKPFNINESLETQVDNNLHAKVDNNKYSDNSGDDSPSDLATPVDKPHLETNTPEKEKKLDKEIKSVSENTGKKSEKSDNQNPNVKQNKPRNRRKPKQANPNAGKADDFLSDAFGLYKDK